MAQDTESPDRDSTVDENHADESDDSMFTDSFAPRDEQEPDSSTEDPLAEVEEQLPQAEPVEGPATLP